METTEVGLKRSSTVFPPSNPPTLASPGGKDTGIISAYPRRSPQLFIGFSDHHGIGPIVGFSVAVFVFILVVIIVWVSRRRRVASNGELSKQSGNTLRDACGQLWLECNRERSA
jgi:hypothetical protein